MLNFLINGICYYQKERIQNMTVIRENMIAKITYVAKYGLKSVCSHCDSLVLGRVPCLREYRNSFLEACEK